MEEGKGVRTERGERREEKMMRKRRWGGRSGREREREGERQRQAAGCKQAVTTGWLLVCNHFLQHRDKELDRQI